MSARIQKAVGRGYPKPYRLHLKQNSEKLIIENHIISGSANARQKFASTLACSTFVVFPAWPLEGDTIVATTLSNFRISATIDSHLDLDFLGCSR